MYVFNKQKYNTMQFTRMRWLKPLDLHFETLLVDGGLWGVRVTHSNRHALSIFTGTQYAQQLLKIFLDLNLNEKHLSTVRYKTK